MSRLDWVQNWPQLAKKAQYNPRKLAAECHISLSQLDRYFRFRFLKTPGVWLRQVRLQEGARMLLYPGSSVKAVALELGYSDSSQFCHEFKRQFGCTPYMYVSQKRGGPSL
jgi:AraC-like DNA-binding protein